MAEGRTRSMFLRDSAIVLVIIAGAAAIHQFEHHESVRNHVGVAADVETLTWRRHSPREVRSQASSAACGCR
jgi:hypothetical protein